MQGGGGVRGGGGEERASGCCSRGICSRGEVGEHSWALGRMREPSSPRLRSTRRCAGSLMPNSFPTHTCTLSLSFCCMWFMDLGLQPTL